MSVKEKLSRITVVAIVAAIGTIAVLSALSVTMEPVNALEQDQSQDEDLRDSDYVEDFAQRLIDESRQDIDQEADISTDIDLEGVGIPEDIVIEQDILDPGPLEGIENTLEGSDSQESLQTASPPRIPNLSSQIE